MSMISAFFSEFEFRSGEMFSIQYYVIIFRNTFWNTRLDDSLNILDLTIQYTEDDDFVKSLETKLTG
jgi:hypothetical protein